MRRTLVFTLLVLSLLCGGLFSQSTGVTGDNDINKCESKTYTISILNNSGNPLTELVITNEINALTGFEYVAGSTSIDINGGAPIATADPFINPAPVELVWNIDTLTGGPVTLNDGDTLNITFALYAGCEAVSGSQNVTIDYLISGTPSTDSTNFSVRVLPGGVTIKKTPNVIPQELGQNVTWTLTVENTGIGTISNVVVTDDLGTGLAYVSSTPAGSNSGQTTTWTSSQIPALALMNPGDIVTIDITSTVIACQLLDNVANVKWGCDSADTCFDTAVDGGTATASVQRIVKTPLIEYTPPNISFNYCEDFVDVSFPVQNTGDGTAHDVWINIDFGAMTVTNLPPGAIYNNTDKRFEISTPIPSGGTFNLGFRLNYSTWCGGSFPEGDLLWQTEYKDDCDQVFYPPVRLSSMNSPTGVTSVAIDKNGSPEAVQIGSQVTYNITSSYTGDISCGSGTAGVFTVVDTIPDGFTVVDPGGGVWVPGGGGTGGTITWTYTPPASLTTSIIVQLPDRSQCESFCFTLFTNTVTVSGTDCCGCVLSEHASQTTAIECEELVNSDKTVSPSIGIRCTNFQYTNTYDFAAGANIPLNTFSFEEHADNQQQYVPGSLSIMYDGADITGCATITDNTPGGHLILDFSGCAADLVANKNLTITYQLTITENTASACSDTGFYSWSSLDMGVSGGECLADGIIRETQYVTVDPPAMSVSVTGLGNIVHKCESQTITITLTQDSNIADPKDVRLVLSGLNYYVTDPAATLCGGSVSPVSCTPTIVGDDYVWEFADNFTGAGSNATLQMTVQKRCTGSGDLTATAYFDDNCNDDANYDDTCSTSATETPALLLGGDLLIEKNPEVYYASETQVAWKIYVTNRGSGNAYNVWVDDVLGAGLVFNSATVSPNTGVTVTANQDHTGGAINGAYLSIDAMAPGERREITFYADQIDCDNLTNHVSASWGCVGIDCQTVVTDDSIVELPDPLLINTNNVTTPIDVCSTVDGAITLKNAGQTTCYNLQVTETLAPGLTYVPGSTRWRLNSGPWNGPNAAYDPNPTTSPLQWTSTEIPGLATVSPGDIIEIDFDMEASCPFQSGNVSVSTSYENPCGKIFTNADSQFEVSLREPQITVEKTRVNEPIDCGDLVEWTITVTNTSGYTLPIIWVEDTLGAAFTYTSSVGDPPFTTDNGTFDGSNKVTWELLNINHNDSVTLTLRATADSPPCSPTVDNTATAWWGCGAADGSSNTKPGVDPPDNTLCLASSGTTDTNTATRQPSIAFLGITVSPIQINSCDDSTELTVTINNTGPTDARYLDLEITLPPGITYNAGTSAVHIGVDDSGIPAAVGDPSVSGSTITYYDLADTANNIANTLEADGGNDTLVLKFSVQSNCYQTSDITFDLNYFDCCEDTQYSDTTSQTVTALFPDIGVTKTPASSQVDCGGDQAWTITVTNNGTGNAEVVRVEDTLGDWIDFVSAIPAATSLGGQVYGWEINNLASGASTSFTITGNLNPDAPQSNCSQLLRQNNVRAVWGCGVSGDATDGDPITTAYDCTNPTWANATPALLQMPDLVVSGITPNITCSDDGVFGGTITVSVQNQGDGNSNYPFTVQVSDGKGWTGTGTYSNNIAPGATVTVTIDVSSWSPVCQPCAAPYSFDVTVDFGNAICECNEANNTFGPSAYTVPIPNLTVQSDTLAITCAGDSSISVGGNVTLQNIGCGPLGGANIPVRFTLYDNTGCSGAVIDQWTDTLSTAGIAANGGTQSLAISAHTIASNLCDNSNGCQVSIQVEVDYSNVICECDGTDNTYCADNKAVDIPDIVISGDTLELTCNSDGVARVSGTITVTNNGCGSNLISDFPVRFTLYDNTGCAGNNYGQWSQTLSGVNIPAGGGSQTFTINPRLIPFDMVTHSTGCQVSIRVEADYPDTVCECDNTNNIWCADNKAVDIPDLETTGENLSITCESDGNIRASGTVTIVNNGCGSNMTSDIPVRFTLFDNTGCAGNQVAQWTDTLSSANIAPGGGTQTFTITPEIITTNSCANSTGCNISLRIEVDHSASICESDGTDNDLCTDKTISMPDLTVTGVTPTSSCVADGNLTGSVTVNVSNTGCGDATGAVVRVTSDCGITFTDQTVDLPAGGNASLTFTFTPTCAACTCTFTATIDPGSAICECDGTNNSLASAPYTIDVPNLVTQSDTLQATCATDNQFSISGTVTVRNDGCGANATADIPVRFTLFDNTGCSGNQVAQWTDTLSGASIASGGGTQTFTITPYAVVADLCSDSTSCQFSIRVELDYTGSICECDGTDNTYCADNKNVDLPDIQVANDTLAINCASDGHVTVSGSVTLGNNGCGSNLTDDVDVRFTLFDNTGCSGNILSQWTQTFSGVNIASGGGTQAFTVTPVAMVLDMIANSTNCQVSILIEADSTGTVCECDGTNNTRCADPIPVDIPDLEPSADSLTIGFNDDGSIQVTGDITIVNNGCGSNMINDIPVRFTIYDNINCTGGVVSQWTETLTGASIAPGGGTQTFTITPEIIPTDICANSTGCQVSILVEVDYSNTICESDGLDNSLCTDKAVTAPELTVNSVTPAFTCLDDGNLSGTVTVNVGNTGCGTATDAVVRLVSDCGFTFADQTVTLPPSGNSDLIFTFTPMCSACTCTFTAIIDPDNTISECDGTNNSTTAAPFTIDAPDLLVQSHALMVDCSADNQFTVSGAITVQNDGCGANATADIPVRFTLYDNTGCSGNQVAQWTDTLSGVNIPSGGGTQSLTITPELIGADLRANSTNCQFSIQVELDYSGAVCECDGSNNTYCADPIGFDIPDITIQGDTLGITCLNDGQASITGTVTLANDGCGATLTADVPMRFTLYDSTGCSGNVLSQWTETFNAVNIPALGADQTFTINPHMVVSNLVANSSNCNVSILVEADVSNSVCETDGSNNTWCADNKAVDIPDLETPADNLTVACTSDGNVRVSGDITIANMGCGSNVTAPIPVRFTMYDNSGCTGTVLSQWTEILGGANIAPGGGTQSFSITNHDITLDACSNSNNCNYSILVETDYTTSICESDGTDNNLCSDKVLAIPNLTITSVASSIVCLSDGSLTGTTVTVTNDGCAPANNVTVRLVSDCGLTFSDETVDLAAGESKDVLFLFASGIVSCSCNFTATIDPDDTICECNGADNTMAGTTSMLIPDLEVQSETLAVTCNEDGVFLVSGTVTLRNNGCGPDLTGLVPMRFTLYSGSGCSGDIITQWTENFSAAAIASAGGTQIFTIQPYEFSSDLCKESGDCQASVFIEADYNDSICEWDGTDNTLCGDKILEFPDLAVNSVTSEVTCSADGQLQGTVTVNVGNTGCADADRVRVRLISDCGLVFDNKTVNLPQGSRRNLVFNFTPTCDSDTCAFTAIIDPARDFCECSRTNNQRTLETLLPRVNLTAAEITASCNPDNTVALTVKVENNGNQDISAASIRVYDTGMNRVFDETRTIAAGAVETITFDAGPYLAGGQMTFHLKVDEDNSVCECDGSDNESSVSIDCPMAGTPGLDIERTCGPAQKPGGIYVFTIKVTNSGDADVTDCVVEDQLPDMLQYVHNSATIDGEITADPEDNGNLKYWNIGVMTAGQTVIIQYQAIPASDSAPGRYCNRAQARGTALNGDPIQSEDSDCCVVLTRTNEGCCLRIIEDPRGFFQQPDLPLSFVDPLFNTERGMMTAFAALDLYKNADVPSGSHAESLKRKLKNYALSTIEEFYLTSRQGMMSEDNVLWLSYGAAYPAGNGDGWTGKRVNRTMTVAQAASELLALNRALDIEEDPVKQKTFETIINKKVAFLEKHTGKLPHSWQLPKPGEEAITIAEPEASLNDKATLYLAATDLNPTIASGILESMEGQLEELRNAGIRQDLIKEHLLHTLALVNGGHMERAKANMSAIIDKYKSGAIKFDTLYLNALATAVDFKTGGSLYNELFKKLVQTYRVKESGVFAEIQPDLTYKLDLDSLGALIMAFQSQLPRESDLFTATMYRMVEESGLFITRKNLVVERTPLTLLKHYSFDEELLPMLSFTKGDRHLAPVFVEEAFVHSPSHLPATKNVIPDRASKVLIPEQKIDITETGLLSTVMQTLGVKLQTFGKRIVKEKGRSLQRTGRDYFEYLLESSSGVTSGASLAIPYQSAAIRGQKEPALNNEPIETRAPFAAETLANYLLAGSVYMENPGAGKEDWLRAKQLQKRLLDAFATIGYVPATFKLFVDKANDSIRVEASEERASRVTLAKLLKGFGGDNSFLLNQLKQTDTPLKPEDMLTISHIPGMATHFDNQLKVLYDDPQPGVNGIAAAILAGDILKRDTTQLREKLEKLWNRRMELPASVETETIESGLLHHYNSPQFLLYLSANAVKQSEFQFQRTLNMFTYLVEMGREGTPASSFWLVEDNPRQHAEPGDVLSLKVRVTNDCEPNFMRPLTIPSLFIKAEFSPNLVYNGTEFDEEIDVLGSFRWKYSNFDKSDYLTYIYQALIPKEYRDNYIEGVIVASGSAGVLDMDPDKIAGDRCIDKWEIERVPVLPLKQMEIQVFGDLNANGKKDPGETGIAGIQFRDTRGNIYRSNSEGQFVISVGDDTVGLQIQVQTIPSNYTLSTPVTRRINRHTPTIAYGLVPGIEVSGIVYSDDNQNGTLDPTDKKMSGIVIQAKLKEAVTSAETPGQFIFKSLPESWLKEIRVADHQPFNTTIPPANLSIQIIKKGKNNK